jgi:predicted PurR-regulated permease PerM
MDQPTARDKIGIERVTAWVILFSLVVVSLIYFSSFLQPLMLAIMVWYFIYVFRDYAGRMHYKERRLPEWVVTILAFVFIILVSFGIVEIVSFNLEKIIQRFPIYVEGSKRMLDSVESLPGLEDIQSRVITRIEEFDFRPLLTGLLNGLSGIAGNIFLIIIYVGFLLVEEKLFKKKLELSFNGGGKAGGVKKIIEQINESVRTYVFVKTQMSLLTGFLSYVILALFGVDFPVLWAFLIFLLNYIPYIGSLVATLFPAAFAVFQFQSFAMFIWIFLAIQVVQFAIGNILEPKVMGRTLNLSPLGVLLALTFWGIIWGILGMILSVPITSILVIIASRVPRLRFIAIWLSETGDLPIEDPDVS